MHLAAEKEQLAAQLTADSEIYVPSKFKIHHSLVLDEKMKQTLSDVFPEIDSLVFVFDSKTKGNNIALGSSVKGIGPMTPCVVIRSTQGHVFGSVSNRFRFLERHLGKVDTGMLLQMFGYFTWKFNKQARETFVIWSS
jgi:hypothetical protein